MHCRLPKLDEHHAKLTASHRHAKDRTSRAGSGEPENLFCTTAAVRRRYSKSWTWARMEGGPTSIRRPHRAATTSATPGSEIRPWTHQIGHGRGKARTSACKACPGLDARFGTPRPAHLRLLAPRPPPPTRRSHHFQLIAPTIACSPRAPRPNTTPAAPTGARPPRPHASPWLSAPALP